MSNRVFFHVDLDAFFASVEQLDFPEYRGKPVIVGGLPGQRRSVVSTASYEARKFGVHSAMPASQAYRLCPNGIYLRGRMQRYHEKSEEIMAILADFSPDVQQMSIDEAFLDMTGTERLFGEPVETARKLKKRIADETGLTISVGIAATKYLAKIASGMIKPDGLFYIEPGCEQDFMRNLPLKKVWGIGAKTLERLNKAGFRTTGDISRASRNLLESMFGQSAGAFLYNAVRGIETDMFPEDAKSRSISAEHTFPFDLTDSYTIETELMRLADEVLFRLLKEKWHSKTVCVKIRYDDFSTVHVQNTGSRNISSAEDFFSRAKELFYKKYETGRGIRLLGLGALNLEKQDGMTQSELFDFGDKKIRAVEKAVLDIREKDPSVKIKKARFLIKLLLLVCLASSPLHKTQAQNAANPARSGAVSPGTDTGTAAATAADSGAADFGAASLFLLPSLPALQAEAPKSLFQYDIRNKNIEFIADGYWESKISGTATFQKKNGKAWAADFGTPVLEQDVDLTCWFLLNKSWYFEAAFADSFDKNTVAAGYYGEGYLKHARAGNNSIIFPDDYTADGIGGGKNQAPGFMMHFEGDKWQADTAVRYDSLSSKEKEYVGATELSEIQKSLTAWERGRRFAFPADASGTNTAARISGIYVQDSDGTYYDASGCRYTKLEDSAFLLKPSQGVLLLATAYSGKIAVSFYSDSDGKPECAAVQTAMTAYLDDIQTYFGPVADGAPDIRKFSYGGSDNSGFFTKLGASAGAAAAHGTHLLVISNPPFFSPFMIADHYKLGTQTYDDAAVVSAATGVQSDKYAVTVTDDDAVFTDEDVISAISAYAVVVNTGHGEHPYTDAGARYPFADSLPELYVQNTTAAQTAMQKSADYIISLKSYKSADYYDIGTNAVPGTIRIYKNGIIQNNAEYDQKTGRIQFSVQPTSMDKIRITWQENATDGATGSIAAAAGFKYRFSDNAFADTVISAHWSYTPDASFSTPDQSAPGTVSWITGIGWQGAAATVTSAFSAELAVDDVTGIMRIQGMNDLAARTVYLGSSSGVDVSADITPELNIRGTEVFPVLEEAARKPFDSTEMLRDSAITGYAADLQWQSVAGETDNTWRAYSVALGASASEIQSAGQFAIALRNTVSYSETGADFDIYLQLGVSADDDLTWENSSAIPTWRISKKKPADADGEDVLTSFVLQPADDTAATHDGTATGWQKAAVKLSDADRALLAQNQDARIIIVQNQDGAAAAYSCGLRIGPYEISGTSFALSDTNGLDIVSEQRKDTDSAISGQSVSAAGGAAAKTVKLFNTDGSNNVQLFKWTKPAAAAFSEAVVFTKYIPEMPVSSYRTVNFILYIPKPADGNTLTGLRIILDRPDSSDSAHFSSGKTALNLFLNTATLKKVAGTWQTVSIDMTDGTVTVGGANIACGRSNTDDTGDESNYCAVSTDTAPTRLRIKLVPPENDAAFAESTELSGFLYIDELYLDGSTPRFGLKNETNASWAKTGTLLSAGSFPLAADPAASFTANTRYSVTENTGGIHGNAKASVTLAGIQFSGNIAAGAGTDDTGLQTDSAGTDGGSETAHIITAAGHTVSTTPAIPLFKYLALSEQYQLSRESVSAEKLNTLTLSVPAAKIPVLMSFSAQGTAEKAKHAQKLRHTFSAVIPMKIFQYQISTSLSAEEQRKGAGLYTDSDNAGSYAENWKTVSGIQFSGGNADAKKRIEQASLTQTFMLPFLQCKPTFTVEGKNSYAVSTVKSNTVSTVMAFSIPFTVQRHTFSFSWKKTAKEKTTGTNYNTYAGDTDHYYRTMSGHSWFFSSIPVYDLCSSGTADAIAGKTTGTNLVAYTTSYAASWRRPAAGNAKLNVILPSHITASVSRDIQNSETLSFTDIMQVKATAGFSAFNCFGRFSAKPVFRWYEQDEIIQTYTASLKYLDRSATPSAYSISGYDSFSLFLTRQNTLQQTVEFQISGKDTWNVKTALTWRRNIRESLLVNAAAGLFPAIGKYKMTLKRINLISYRISDNSAMTNEVSASHKLEMQAGAYLTLTGELQASFISIEDSGKTLELTASLTGKIKL